MKLNKLIYSVSLCAAGLTFAACSDIEEDERFIYVEPANIAKRVLIEDFTGQGCVNCPNGNLAIERMQEEYGADNVIAVGMHSGPLGRGSTLRTDDGDWYYDHWGISVQPTAYIDRREFSPDYNMWATAVRNYIQIEPEVMLDAACSYDAATRTLGITVDADGLQTTVNGNLQVWLIENNIVDYQILLDGSWDYEYVHNHVYRASVNDLMGDAITVPTGARETRTFTYTLDEEWVPENMEVVAFIYNNTGVLQAVKTHVTGEPDAEEPVTEE